MSPSIAVKLEHWRRQRARRKARREAAELTRKPMAIRPGGNAPTISDTYDSYRAREVLGHPALKHVPYNTHRAGSIAYALLYNYWLPNATDRK